MSSEPSCSHQSATERSTEDCPASCRGVVVAIESGRATVEVNRKTACQRCDNGQGCGVSLMAQLFSRPVVSLTIDARPHWRVGQMLRLAAPQQDANKALISVTGWLLCGLFAGLFSGGLLAIQYSLSIDLCGLLGAFAGLAVAARFSRSPRQSAVLIPLDWQDEQDDSATLG